MALLLLQALGITELADVKTHCRIDHDAEDELLEKYIDAARCAAEQYLERKLYPTQDDLDADEDADDNALVATPDICHALLMHVASLYRNRESVAAVQLHEVPMGYYSLLMPYRKNLGV